MKLNCIWLGIVSQFDLKKLNCIWLGIVSQFDLKKELSYKISFLYLIRDPKLFQVGAVRHTQSDSSSLTKKTLWPLFMDEVQLPQG